MKKIYSAFAANCKKNVIVFLAFLFCLIMKSEIGFTQSQTVTFTTTGATTWTVPCGVTSITVQAWGGGGAGGGSTNNNVKGGGGGAGGTYVSSVLTVSPGATYNLSVGAGANGTTGAGAKGNDSWFNTTGILNAQGGAGGAAPNNTTVLGGAGSIATSIGTTVIPGVNGGNGTITTSGAGGNGGNSGGAGGGVRTTENNGRDGSQPGGGGSGAFLTDGTDHSGGNGGDGEIIITYNGYCIPSFSSGIYPISNVTFAGINNNSNATANGAGVNDYETFCGITGSVIQGSATNAISITGTTGGFNFYKRVFIDWNQDGDFLDAGETYVIGNGTGNTLTGNIAVPAGAIVGTTVMRVIQMYNSAPTSCQNGAVFGQAEDYTLNVLSPASISTGNITPLTYCGGNTGGSGTAITVPFTSTGTFTGANVYTAQLSNNGFTSFTSIGTLTSTASGSLSISGTIPAGTTAGNNYRVRVISSNPSATGSDNGSNITINNPAVPTGTTPQVFCASASPTVANLTTVTGTGIQWYAAASGGSPLLAATALVNNTHYYASQTVSGCEGSARLDVTATVNTNGTINLSSAAGTDAQTKCINTPITAITYAIGGTGTTGAGITAGAFPSGINGIYSAGVFTISGTPTATGTFNYTITTSGPCTNNSLSGSITVTANGTISLSSAAGTNAQVKCINSAITDITYAIGGTSTNASITAGALPAGITGAFSGGVFTITGMPTATGVFNYTVTASGSGCVNPALSGTITVNDNATISLTSALGTDAQVKCANNAITPITYAVTGFGNTGAGLTAGAFPAGVTGNFAGGIFTISGTPTAVGLFNYTITTSGPCTNNSLSGTITVNTNGTVTLSSAAGTDAQTKCINTAITDITYQIGGDATNASITAGGLPAGVTGSFAGGVFTITGTPTVSGSFPYTVTASGSACGNLSASGTITVNADAIITLSSAVGTDGQTKCINNAITNITYLVGGSGTGVTLTGAFPAGVTGSYNAGTHVYTITGTPTASGTFNYTLTTNGPCVNAALSGSITVQANSTITLSTGTASQTKCINNALTTVTYTMGGGATNVALTSGSFPAGVTGNFAAGVFTISGTPTVAGSFPYTLTATGPCVNATASGTITVNDNSTIALSSAVGTDGQTKCINNAITNITYLVGGGGTGITQTGSFPAGVTGSYNAGTHVYTITGTPTASGTFNYTLTTNGLCVNAALSGSITVQANSTISLSTGAASQTKCINNALTTVTYTMGGGATSIALTSGSFPSGVTGNFSGGVFTISGTPTVAGSFPYTLTATGPCVNATASGTITVNDNATIVLTSAAATTSQTLCINTGLTAITYSIGGFGTTGATVSGLPAGVTGNYNSGTKVFTISGIPTVSGLFSYTVTTTGPCVNTPLGGKILVNANSVLTRTSAASTTSQTICINTGLTNITYSVTGGGTGASITAGALPSGVTGSFAAGVFTISGTPTVSGNFSYTVTTTGPCTNQSLSGTITVNDNATIALTSAAGTTSQTICISTPAANITYLIGGFGTTGATVTGLPAGVTGAYNSGSKVFTISGSPTVSGSFSYTVTTTGPCTNNSLGGTITVTPNATISLTSATGTDAQSLCTNLPITNITYAIGGSGTGATVSGLPTGVTGTYAAGVFTISGTPSITGIFNYTISTNGPCVKPTATGSITTIAVPTGTFTASENSGIANDNIICTGAQVTFTAPAGYNSYIFKVNGSTAQTGTSNTYSTISLPNGASVTVDVANTFNCGTTFGPIVITVNPLPSPTLVSDKAAICPGDLVTFTAGGGTNYNFRLNGSSVQNGTSNTYSTTSFTAVNNPVTVDVTNANGCTATSAPVSVTINPVPTGTLTSVPSTTANSASICAGDNISFTATAGAGNTYTFKVNGTVVQAASSVNTFSSTTLTNPSVVTVDVSNATNCSTTFNAIAVTVNPLPIGTLTLTENSNIANDGIICANSPVTFTATPGYNNYAFYLKGTGAALYSGPLNTYTTSTLVNNDYFTVVVTSSSPCTATFTSLPITVVASPAGTLTVSPSNTICAGDNVTFTATSDPSFTNYLFKLNGTTVLQNGPGNTYSTTALVQGDQVTVDVTNNNTCVTTFNTVTMTVNALPTGLLVAKETSGNTNDDGITCTGANIAFTAPTGFSNYNFILNGASIQNGPSNVYSNAGLFTGNTVTVAVTNAGNCIGLLNTITVTVNPLPSIAAITGTLRTCISSTSILSDATTGGTWSSDNTSVATVNSSTGVVTGITAGTANITYTTLPNGNNCTNSVSVLFTVNAPPTVAPITGNTNVCATTTSLLSDATAGGTWSSDNTAVATIDPASGLVSGVASGTANISYTVTDANGCSTTVSIVVTVTNFPVVPPITTTAPSQFNVCIGGTFTANDATSGGVWSSSDPTVASISATGLVTGLTSGTTDIKYSVTTTCGVGTFVIQTVTVNAPPSATISYNSGNPFCTNAGPVVVTQTGTTGGTYSATGGLAIDPSTGTITPGATGGTFTISYKIAAAGGCGLYTTTTTVTITTLPTITSFGYSGSPYCATVTSAAPGLTASSTLGTYSSTGGLTINVSTGVINPSTSTAGTYTVTYTIAAAGGCGPVSTTTSVTITANPTITSFSYSGTPYCSTVTSASPSLTASFTGGTYSSTGGLTINAATGVINPSTSTAGTYIVTYTIAAGSGCVAVSQTTSVSITAKPTAFAGTAIPTCSNSGAVNITAGSSATNYSSIVWTSSGTGTFANANSLTTATYTPSAADILAGSVILTLTANGNSGCATPATSTKTLTISAFTPIPGVSASPSTICLGNSSNLTISGASSSTLISENFDGTSTFSVVNLVGNSAASAWKNRTSTYTYFYGFFNSVSFNSGSKFMLANSDDGGGTTNTALVSPAVSTMGYSALNLSYRTYFRRNGSETAVVEVSTNGTSWTAVQSLSSTTGAANNFATQTINLNGYLNNSSLLVRFRYTGNNEWWWAVDDVVLTATAPTYNYSWTAVPSATAGLPAGAGTPSNANANIVVTPTAAGPITYTATLTNAAGCTSSSPVVINVNALPVVSISADYCTVPGKVRLTATGTTGVNWLWSTGETTQSIDVDVAGDYDVTVSIPPSGCPATASIKVATELVINGDFEAGDGVGFTTLYGSHTGNYYAGNQANAGAGSGLWPESYYAVDLSAYSPSNGVGYHPSFHGRDHTTGSGKFMMVNGSSALKTIWQETVAVLPNTTYYFSAWGMNLNPGSPAQLQFSVNGAAAGSIGDLGASGVPAPTTEAQVSLSNWIRFYGTWTSGPTTTSAIINIVNLNTVAGGNDFGLDDISFGTLSTFINLESAPGTDAQTPCINTPITPIVYSVGSGGSAPTITPALPAGLTSSFNGVLFTISGTPTVAGNYAYTLTTTGTCQPFTATGTINVQTQTIALTSGSNAPVCKNSTLPALVYTLGGTATGASITAGALPTGVNGVYDGATKTFNITGTPSVAGVFNYTITTTGTCTAATISGTITVTEQTITLNSANNVQTKCINTAIANIQYTIGGTGTGVVLPITGLPAGVSGTFVGGILFISGTPTVSGTFNYTVTTTGTCAETTATGTINVTPVATLALTSAAGTNSQTACNNSAITPITYAVSNGTGASVSGLPAGMTTGYSGGVFTISGSPSPAVTGVYNYTVTATGGCGSSTSTGSITFQAQTISLTTGAPSPSICSGQPITAIVFAVGGTATGASVAGLPAGLSGVYNAGSFTISGSSSAAAGPYMYTITTSGPTCSATTYTGTITISPAATGGTLTSVSICSGTSGTLTLGGQSGSIVRWESSTDNFNTVITPIINTTISQAFTNITVPTQYRVVIGNTCGNVYSSVANVGIHNYWTGGTSTDWNTASNWSDNQLPSASCPAVYIAPGTFQPVISSGTIQVSNLIMVGTGLLTVTNATLQVSGNITSANRIDAATGTIELNGSVAQNISGDYFINKKIKNLTLSNSATVTGSDTLKIAGQLGFSAATSGKAFAAGNSNVTLLSSLTATANVAELKNGNTISGTNFTVERFINTGTTGGAHAKSWQLLATPTTGQTIRQAWQENGVNTNNGYGTELTNPGGTNGYDANTAGPSLKSYNPAGDNYIAVPATTLPFENLNGYYVYVRGDRRITAANGLPANNTVLRSTGSLKSGSVLINNIPAGKYQTVGNPYASPIDLRVLQSNSINTTNDIYIWDPTFGGTYGSGGFRTLTYIDPVNGYRIAGFDHQGTYPGQYVDTMQSGQAFFVKSNGVGPTSVTFTENAKVGGNDGGRLVNGITGETKTELLSVNLTVKAAGSPAVVVDGALAIFGEQYSNGVDWKDGNKINNSANNAGFMRDGKLLAVERRQSPTEKDTLNLNLTGTTRALPYHWDISGENMGDVPGRVAYLWDRYQDKKTTLNLEGTTGIDFTTDANAASSAADRFKIIFALAKPLPVTITSVTATRNIDKTISVNWKVENELNLVNYSIERSADGTSFSSAGNRPATNAGSYSFNDLNPLSSDNYYRIRALSQNGLVQYSNVVKVAAIPLPASISVYPNPVQNKEVNMVFVNEPVGTYQLELTNKIGQAVYKGKVVLNSMNDKKKVSLAYVTAAGLYRLNIKGPDGKVHTIELLVEL